MIRVVWITTVIKLLGLSELRVIIRIMTLKIEAIGGAVDFKINLNY